MKTTTPPPPRLARVGRPFPHLRGLALIFGAAVLLTACGSPTAAIDRPDAEAAAEVLGHIQSGGGDLVER